MAHCFEVAAEGSPEQALEQRLNIALGLREEALVSAPSFEVHGSEIPESTTARQFLTPMRS